MNIQSATIQAFVNVLNAAALTTIPSSQIYREVENTLNNVVSDPVPDIRKLPCVIISSDDPKEIFAYSGQFISNVLVEVNCNADDFTSDQFDAMKEEVSNVFYDQTKAVGMPQDPNFIPRKLSSALDNFTSQFARITGTSTRVIDRRWIGAFMFQVASAQADL